MTSFFFFFFFFFGTYVLVKKTLTLLDTFSEFCFVLFFPEYNHDVNGTYWALSVNLYLYGSDKMTLAYANLMK